MRRYREPVFAAMVVALLASLSVHLPVYKVLGTLADEVFKPRDAKVPQASQVEFELAALDAADAMDKQVPQPEAREKRKRNNNKRVQEQIVPVEPVEVAPREESPPEMRSAEVQAVQQKSRDAQVQAPDHAKFVAEQNNRVEEETVARIRNYVQDHAEPSAGKPQSENASMDEGNADKQEIADSRDKQGSDVRTPTLAETQQKRPKNAPNADPIQGERAAQSAASGKQANNATASQDANWVTLTDAAGGTFRVKKSGAGAVGAAGQGKQGVNLDLSYSGVQAALSENSTRQSQQARIAERLSKNVGGNHAKRWKAFRAAVENFTPGVKPGNQTALNAAASPFANYIAAVHRRIHRHFADKFLAGLSSLSSSPFADPTLRTKLEIVLNRDGSVHRVGVVRPSGLLPFDFGAYNAVLRGQPYAKAPNAILSGDGRVYLHWAFYRNHRQCGTFNAEPFVLNNAPKQKAPAHLFDSGPSIGSSIPKDARPTWGRDGEAGASDKGKSENNPKAPTSKEPSKSKPTPEGDRPPAKSSPSKRPANPQESAPPRRGAPPPPTGAAVG